MSPLPWNDSSRYISCVQVLLSGFKDMRSNIKNRHWGASYLLQSWHSRRILLQKPSQMLMSRAKFGRYANPKSTRCWYRATRWLLGILILLPPRQAAGSVCARPAPLSWRGSDTGGALVQCVAHTRLLLQSEPICKFLAIIYGGWTRMPMGLLAILEELKFIIIRLNPAS